MRVKFYDLPVRLHSENKIDANKVNEKLGDITFLYLKIIHGIDKNWEKYYYILTCQQNNHHMQRGCGRRGGARESVATSWLFYTTKGGATTFGTAPLFITNP